LQLIFIYVVLQWSFRLSSINIKLRNRAITTCICFHQPVILTILRFLHPKKRIEVPSSTPDCFRANLSCQEWREGGVTLGNVNKNCKYKTLPDSLAKQTCKKPLNGASPVPGPIMIIGVDGSAGNLKFDCLTKIGAQLHSSLYSNGNVFCQADDRGWTKSD
jgi:hypothetical protein